MTLLIPSHSIIMLRRELIAEGLSDKQIAALVRQGELVRVRHGAYVAAHAWVGASRAERHRLTVLAVLRQANTSLVVSHRSAGVLHEAPTWGVPLDHVDVLRRDGHAGRRHAGVHQRQGVLEDDDVVVVSGTTVTSATRTAIDAATVLPTEAALVVVNDLLHRELTTKSCIEERYASMQHHPFTLSNDLVFRLARPEIESVGESRTFYLMWRQGLPYAVPQFEVTDDLGRVFAKLDFALPDHGVWIEFDGREKYVKYLRDGESVADAVIREKRREDAVRERTGWVCVRLTWADLTHPERVAHRIRAAIAVAQRNARAHPS